MTQLWQWKKTVVCSNKQMLKPELCWQPCLKAYGEALHKSACSLVVKLFGSDFNTQQSGEHRNTQHTSVVLSVQNSISENSSLHDAGATESPGFVIVLMYLFDIILFANLQTCVL